MCQAAGWDPRLIVETPCMTKQRRVIIQYGEGAEHEHLIQVTRRHHQRYATLWGVDYFIGEPRTAGAKGPHWHRIDLILQMFDRNYSQVVWLDTDCVIVDFNICLFDASGFGIACCECFDSPTIERHLNTGFLIATRSPETVGFLKEWKERPLEGVYEDQSSFINMMKSRPYRELLTILPNSFNCVEQHMEARNPIIRAFHGDPERTRKIEELVVDLWPDPVSGTAQI